MEIALDIGIDYCNGLYLCAKENFSEKILVVLGDMVFDTMSTGRGNRHQGGMAAG